MIEDSVVITISLGVLALIGVIAAEIGWRGTRYAADLSAAQAGREVQVSMLTDFIETVLDTSKAVQSYVFGCPRSNQSDPITVVIELAGDKRREILLSYAA